MASRTTLLQLVSWLSQILDSEAEIVETVVRLVNSGQVELVGNFRGCRFEQPLTR